MQSTRSHRTAIWFPCVPLGCCANVRVRARRLHEPSERPSSCERTTMPEKKTLQRAQRDRREGKAPSTQAGEFVREEMEHIREGKHGARSTKQAIAIGLSKARRAGVPLKPPKPGTIPEKTRRQAEHEYEAGARGVKRTSPRRSKATTNALKREGRSAASHRALSTQAHRAAAKRKPADRSAAARKAARTRAARKSSGTQAALKFK
jgi:hypothetical protein